MKARRWLGVLLVAAASLRVAAATAPAVPIIEVPPAANAGGTGPVMIFLSGDGGWAAFVREISTRLAAGGWGVVGLDMRKYLWKARTPEETTQVVATLAREYLAAWHREELIIGGFSRGADVAPFVVNRLPPDLRARVKLVLMISPGEKAEFEFHLGEYLRKPNPAALRPVLPEMLRLSRPFLLLTGHDDTDALPLPPGADPTRMVRLPGDHHLGYDYTTILAIIRAAARAKPATTLPDPN